MREEKQNENTVFRRRQMLALSEKYLRKEATWKPGFPSALFPFIHLTLLFWGLNSSSVSDKYISFNSEAVAVRGNAIFPFVHCRSIKQSKLQFRCLTAEGWSHPSA